MGGVGFGELDAVKEKSGATVRDSIGRQSLKDLVDGLVCGIGLKDESQAKGPVGAAESSSGLLGAAVEVAEGASAHGDGPAPKSVGLNVAALGNLFHDVVLLGGPYPTPGSNFESKDRNERG